MNTAAVLMYQMVQNKEESFHLCCSGVGFLSDAALRFAGFLRCDSRTIMKSFLKKIARKFTGNLHKISGEFASDSFEKRLHYCTTITPQKSCEKHSGLGCYVSTSYAGAFGYADDIALVAPSMQCLKKMIIICGKYDNSHSITLNPNKSKLLCSNVNDTDVIPPIY